ncbi:MAG TPA: hypothetical protein VFB90_00195 [Dehalococcoidia bacterium]|nr:hypothetical protein [Dehalococcoidia bacterium]
MRLRKLLPLLLFAGVSALAFACGGDGGVEHIGSPEASATGTAQAELTVNPNAEVLNVQMGEWFVRPERSSARAGDLTLSARNGGTTLHELVVIKTDTAEDKLPATNGKVDEEKAGEVIGEIDQFNAGLTRAGTLNLKAGKYVFICNIVGHYELGMHAAFTVQ